MFKKLRLKHYALMMVLAAMVMTMIPMMDTAKAEDALFEDDTYSYSEKAPSDDESVENEVMPDEDNFFYNAEGEKIQYNEYVEPEEEIEAQSDEIPDWAITKDDAKGYSIEDGEPGPRAPRPETYESEMDAIKNIEGPLRKDLEDEIKEKYAPKPFGRSAAPSQRKVQTVDRNVITYDLDATRVSGDTLVVSGFAFTKDMQNFLSPSVKKTHETIIVLRNRATGDESIRVTAKQLPSKNFTNLMGYDQYSNCPNTAYYQGRCNYVYDYVRFSANIDLKRLDPNVDYNMFLEIKAYHSKAPGGYTHQRIPVYHQDENPLHGTLSNGSRFNYKSDFAYSKMYTESPYLRVRTGPDKNNPVLRTGLSCYSTGNIAYFEQNASRGSFIPQQAGFDRDGVRWFRFNYKTTSCRAGVPMHGEANNAEIKMVRGRIANGGTVGTEAGRNRAWGTVPFMHFAGDPLEIRITTPSSAREIHKASDGKVLFDKSFNSWFNGTWSYAPKAFTDYDYVNSTGHARSGVFDNGKNKNVVVNFNYKPKKGDVKLIKTDETGKGVGGVTFEISYTSDFKQSWKYTTASNGEVTSKNWEPGTIYYREVAVPSPIIINRGTKSAKIISNRTVNVGVTNPIAKGRINITKVDEYGKLLPNIKFRIRNRSNVIVKDIVTNAQGVASISNLPLGRYTIEELDVKHYYIKPAIITVDIKYQNADTPTVVHNPKITNKFQPIADIGVNRLRVNTKTASQGLDVESWYDKNLLYDYDINKFRDTNVTMELTDYNTGQVIDSKTYTIEAMPTYQVFKVPSSRLNKGEKKDLRVNVKSSDESKVTVKTRKTLTIDGYTAEEKNTKVNAVPGATVVDKKIVRTDRAYGKNIQYFYETLTLKVPSIEKLRTGSSFKYGIEAEYKNDLGTNSTITMNTTTEGKILDGEGPEYKVDNTLYGGKGGKSFNLTAVGKRFTPPVMYAKKDIDSDIITQNKYNSLSASAKRDYRKVDGDLVSAIWQADLGEYKLDTKTNQIGVHRLSYDLNSKIDTFAFMYGHYNDQGTSGTITSDRILITPISSFTTGGDIPEMWKDQMPDNWGVQNARSGSRQLTEMEKKFFGY